MSIIYYNELLQNANNVMDDRLIELLNEKMNTDEQKQFINNFKNYLEYGNDDTKFIISLDNVWEWVGFSRKGHAKTLLIKKFIENKDFIYIRPSAPAEGPIINQNGIKETILLNVSTFKKFCMKASTDRADEICDYYVKMENIMNQYTKEKIIELENSNKKLLKDEEIDINELFWNENSISDFNNKNVVYLAFIGYINGIAYYKYGVTKQIYTREFLQHKKTFDTFIMIHIELCDNMIFVENEFKYELKSKDLLKSQEINGRKHIELFITNPQNNIKKIIQILKDLVIKYPLEVIKNSNDEIQKLKLYHENENLKSENEKLKLENEILKLKQNKDINYDDYKELKDDNKELKEDNKELKINNKTLKEKYKNLKQKLNQINNENTTNENITNKNTTNENITNENTTNKNITNKKNKKNIEDIEDILILNNIEIEPEIIDYENHKFNIKYIVEEALKNNIVNNEIFEPNIPEIEKYKNKDIDLFLDKYVETGEDSKENYCRLPVVKFYSFYVSLFANPSPKAIFNEYIAQKYNVISKGTHNNYQNKVCWFNIKIKNIKKYASEIDILMKLFIERYCDLNENYFETSRKFNKVFKEFCKINSFETTKSNGWSELKCIKSIEESGFIFDKNKTKHYQTAYLGIRIKPEYSNI
jgi:hypothetical protein